MDLVSAWNNMLSALGGGGLWLVLGVLGIALVVISIVKWWWDKRRGGGIGGFPFIAVLLGVTLAAPRVVIPAVLLLIQGLITIVVNIISYFGGQL